MAYTKMLNDIVLLIVGGIGGVIGKKGITSAVNAVTPTYTPPPSQPVSTPSVNQGFNWIGFKNPDLDESWTPGPPPTTPPDYIDPSKEEIAHERAIAKSEAV